MAEEIVVKIKLVPDNTAIDKYISKLGKTSIALRGMGGPNAGGGVGGGKKELDDTLKKNLKIFKADLLLRWIKRIWQIAEKNIPLMNVLAKMNNSLIRLFLFPIMMRVFKILLPIYRELFKLGQWWVTGGFEKILDDILGKDVGKGPSPSTIIQKGIVATLGLEGIGKILMILAGKIKDNILVALGKVGESIGKFIKTWGLDEIANVFKTKFIAIIEKLGLSEVLISIKAGLSKLLSPITSLTTSLGESGLLKIIGKVVGTLTSAFNLVMWMSLIGDVFDVIGRFFSEWVGVANPILKRFFDTMSVGGQFFSSVLGLVISALKDLWEIIFNGQRNFSNLMDAVSMSAQLLANFGKFILGPFTPKAAGGPVSGGQSYLVGEKGPEIFTPGIGGNITPNNKISSGTSIGNINVTINTTKIDSSNLNQIAKEISDRIYTDVRRRVTF